jgi:hypothetical protein
MVGIAAGQVLEPRRQVTPLAADRAPQAPLPSAATRPQPTASQRLCMAGGVPGGGKPHTLVGPGPPRRRCRRGPEQGPGSGLASRDSPGPPGSGAGYWPTIGAHGARRRARCAWLARRTDPLPDGGEPVVPAALNAQTVTAIRQASGWIRPCSERESRSASRRCHALAARSSPSGPDSANHDNATSPTPIRQWSKKPSRSTI